MMACFNDLYDVIVQILVKNHRHNIPYNF